MNQERPISIKFASLVIDIRNKPVAIKAKQVKVALATL